MTDPAATTAPEIETNIIEPISPTTRATSANKPAIAIEIIVITARTAAMRPAVFPPTIVANVKMGRRSGLSLIPFISVSSFIGTLVTNTNTTKT